MAWYHAMLGATPKDQEQWHMDNDCDVVMEGSSVTNLPYSCRSAQKYVMLFQAFAPTLANTALLETVAPSRILLLSFNEIFCCAVLIILPPVVISIIVTFTKF